ncbi:hypothetical protein [Bradyrhizobium sp.]|uniref:hypothetical protein n=1 Tax=Bradyrhizobium sp. TaxID=376 RepID=UPI001D4F44E8|nr:hypothetical protein [Bradyrhizobium sp.]MBI5320200.1 hypothetical protein [Bradyrhizobium sp.]
MVFPLRLIVVLLCLPCCALPLRAAPDKPLERGTAITDPLALRDLDRGRFGLGRILQPARAADAPLDNAQLFAMPAMASVRAAIDAEFERYIARHNAELPGESIGVGEAFAFQLFDRALLSAAETRFVLAGIVNRMDRAFVAPSSCGEIRLIYRLTRTGPAGGETSSRLPMTLNIVLRAKGETAVDRDGRPVTCAAIAQRWLATSDLPQTGRDLAAKLQARDGPLDLVMPENIDRIEINLQIAHAPKSPRRDFRTDYLLKVFRHDAQARVFREAPMENQIDRARLLADPALAREFKAWLLDPVHFAELDRGTILIPEKFLASAAIAPTPVGFVPSSLLPEFGLSEGEGSNAVFSEGDVVAALKKAASDGRPLQNIRSFGGFQRRLNDITCAGCHQTRGIGGFHFPGVDWMAARPSNTTVVPASPHFFGDQVRRRDILAALRDGKLPDYSRGFASRPQLRGTTGLAGTEYSDGWGAHCYRLMRGNSANDASFRGWTCAKGLACQVTGTARMGMCFVGAR